jgi:hypothetical protein
VYPEESDPTFEVTHPKTPCFNQNRSRRKQTNTKRLYITLQFDAEGSADAKDDIGGTGKAV